ncbi:MAG: hypothetical protein QOK47_1491 [Actinomycetota bacterium]|nr:hypothetical protein [Actinomycetota bacterium]
MIRDARPEDVPGILSIYGPIVQETEISFESESPTIDDLTARVQRSHVWLVDEDAGAITGYAYAAPFHERAGYRWSVEISVYVDANHQRSGIGRALVEALLACLVDMGFVNVFAGVALPNTGSVRLFESLGFEQIALQKEVGFKLGRWIDVGWWQKHLRERSDPPPELDL